MELCKELDTLLELCEDKEQARACFLAMLNLGISVEEITNNFIIVDGRMDFKLKILEILSDIWNRNIPITSYEKSVSQIKKEIKHSNNPMEKKKLEKQLNTLYLEEK